MRAFKFISRNERRDSDVGIIFAETEKDALLTIQEGFQYNLTGSADKISIEEFNVLMFPDFVIRDCDFINIKRT